jgi:archaemetzincin
MKIVVVPFGFVDKEILSEISSGLNSVFGYEVEIHAPIDIHGRSYDPKRNQYEVSELLAGLKKIHLKQSEKILGVAAIDLFAEGLNFVFGQAELAGSAAIISLARLRQEFYGSPPDRKLLMERILKEAVHELGHTFGLGHCPDPKCVMHFSNSLHDTDIKGIAFCPNCQPQMIA